MFKTISRGVSLIEYDRKTIKIIDNEGYSYETEARMVMEDHDNGIYYYFWIEILVETADHFEEEWIMLPTSHYRFDLDADYEDEKGNVCYPTIEDMYEEADRRFNALTVLDFTGKED